MVRIIDLHLNAKKANIRENNRVNKRFTFEHKWLFDEEFLGYFTQSWEDIYTNQSLQATLLQCSLNLTIWAGNRFDHLGRKIKELRRELNGMLSSNVIKQNFVRIRKLEREIEKLTDQEEMHWAQRSRGIG